MWTKKNSEMKTREQFCQIVAVEFIECVCRFHLRLLKLQCERRELLPVLRFTLPTVHRGSLLTHFPPPLFQFWFSIFGFTSASHLPLSSFLSLSPRVSPGAPARPRLSCPRRCAHCISRAAASTDSSTVRCVHVQRSPSTVVFVPSLQRYRQTLLSSQLTEHRWAPLGH